VQVVGVYIFTFYLYTKQCRNVFPDKFSTKNCFTGFDCASIFMLDHEAAEYKEKWLIPLGQRSRWSSEALSMECATQRKGKLQHYSIQDGNYIKLIHPLTKESVTARFVNFYKLQGDIVDVDDDDDETLGEMMYLGCVLPMSKASSVPSSYDFVHRAGFSVQNKKQLVLFPWECFVQIEMVYWDTVLKKIIYLN
jgi:hypothetical protein